MPTGGELLVAELKRQRTGRIFCVPGESYLAVLDALHDAGIPITVARHEGGAAFMAEAMGKLTGRPGIAMVTRGPGATNAACGIHVAMQDHTPMIVFVGQVARGMLGREAFQEVDYRALFGGLAKWTTEIEDAARVPEIVARAFRVAVSGRPGPVVVALPEDMLTDVAEDAADMAFVERPAIAPPAAEMETLADTLAGAERPFLLLGGAPWTAKATQDIRVFAERFGLPTSVTFRRQMLFDHEHPNYAGDVGLGCNPALLDRIRTADVLIVVGDRLSEIPTQGFELLRVPRPVQHLVHVVPDPDEIGRVYQPHQPILADPETFAAAAARLDPPQRLTWNGAAAEAHASYLAWSDAPPQMPGPVQMRGVMATLADRLGPDAILANGAGNYATWLHRFHRFRAFGTQLAPTSGTMGYGMPAAIAAKLRHPDRDVIAFAGDGCFQMTGNEFATAAQAGAAIVVLVFDNGMYGTIRMHQERDYPGRVTATRLENPDFAALARASGGHGETVEATDDFAPALDRAIAAGVPAIVHLKIDPRAIAPGKTL